MKNKSEKKKNDLSKLKKNYENLPQWKKDALDKWTEDLKKSCTYWEDREY